MSPCPVVEAAGLQMAAELFPRPLTASDDTLPRVGCLPLWCPQCATPGQQRRRPHHGAVSRTSRCHTDAAVWAWLDSESSTTAADTADLSVDDEEGGFAPPLPVRRRLSSPPPPPPPHRNLSPTPPTPPSRRASLPKCDVATQTDLRQARRSRIRNGAPTMRRSLSNGSSGNGGHRTRSRTRRPPPYSAVAKRRSGEHGVGSAVVVRPPSPPRSLDSPISAVTSVKSAGSREVKTRGGGAVIRRGVTRSVTFHASTFIQLLDSAISRHERALQEAIERLSLASIPKSASFSERLSLNCDSNATSVDALGSSSASFAAAGATQSHSGGSLSEAGGATVTRSRSDTRIWRSHLAKYKVRRARFSRHLLIAARSGGLA